MTRLDTDVSVLKSASSSGFLSNGANKGLWRPLQGGSVSCDSSSLVDPLKLSTKSHTQTFSPENLRQTEKLVSFPLISFVLRV